MQFSKHLGKGLWGIADKMLPVIYGVSFVVLVIRVLPEEEFGNFVLIQEIFLILSNLAAAFALQPLLKFGSEERENLDHLVGATLLLNIAFLVIVSVVVIALQAPIAVVLKAPALAGLMIGIPAMLAANFVRNYTLVLLQTTFQFQRVFWIDAAHFLVAPALILVLSWLGEFNSASDLIFVNLCSLTLSSVVGLVLARREFRVAWAPPRAELRRVWIYGKYALGNIVGYLFYSRADSFFLSAFGGPAAVATYNSIKVFVRLYDMVPQIVQMFVLPAVSRLQSLGETDRLRALVEKAITFTTVAMMPVFLLLLLFSPQMLGFFYAGRYSEAIPLLQILSVVALLIPAIAVSSNVLMALGEVRLNFILNLRVLGFLLGAYLLLIPLLGPLGVSLGFLAASVLQAWLFTAQSSRLVPVTMRGLWARVADIRAFVRDQMGRLSGNRQ